MKGRYLEEILNAITHQSDVVGGSKLQKLRISFDTPN